jgi:hypothetical protein
MAQEPLMRRHNPGTGHLRRPDLQLAGYLGHDLGDFDGAAQQVDALAS